MLRSFHTTLSRSSPILRSALTSAAPLGAFRCASSIPTPDLGGSAATPPDLGGSAAAPDLGGSADLAPAADAAAEAVNGLINPGGFSPVYWACDALQAIQATTGLPWWASIVATTAVLRTALLPFAIKQMKFTGRVQQVQPKIQYLTAKMKEHSPGSELHNMYAIQLRDLVQKHDVNPLKMFMFPMIQAPVFVSMFMALRRLAENGTYVPGLESGGLAWFTDLSAADPYYALPVLAGGSFLLTVELGAEMPNVQQQSTMKNVMRGLAAVMVFATYAFPASVFCYWITSNTFSLAQAMVFKVPGVKDALGIPPPPDPAKTPKVAASSSAPDASAFQELKDAFNKQKELRNEIQKRSKEHASAPASVDTVDAELPSASAADVVAAASTADVAAPADRVLTAAELLAASADKSAASPAARRAAKKTTRHKPGKTVARARSYGRKRRK